MRPYVGIMVREEEQVSSPRNCFFNTIVYYILYTIIILFPSYMSNYNSYYYAQNPCHVRHLIYMYLKASNCLFIAVQKPPFCQ